VRKGLKIVVSAFLFIALIGALIGQLDNDDAKSAAKSSAKSTTAKVVFDSAGYNCKSDQTKYGRCPGNPYFGFTGKEARAASKQAAENEARRQALQNAWKKGYTEFSDGIAYKWDSSVCDASYSGCWGMRVVTRDGCDSLYVELQIQNPAGGGSGLDERHSIASCTRPGRKS
jgi:hypothetical protein